MSLPSGNLHVPPPEVDSVLGRHSRAVRRAGSTRTAASWGSGSALRRRYRPAAWPFFTFPEVCSPLKMLLCSIMMMYDTERWRPPSWISQTQPYDWLPGLTADWRTSLPINRCTESYSRNFCFLIHLLFTDLCWWFITFLFQYA